MTNASEGDLWALILAGGDGTRLQALTRVITGAPIPKQYCRILGVESLLEATLSRAAAIIPPRRTLVIVNRDHLALAREQVRSLPAENVVVQPCNRDTGPGIATALLELSRRAPNASVAVFPSDHFVADEVRFRTSVERMVSALSARPDKVALLGIRPEHPDPSFGYIVPAGPSRAGLFAVARFEEKPPVPRAAEIIRSGGLWSSFVMSFRLARLVELLRSARPADFAALERLGPGVQRNSRYGDLERWNFSRDFLERNVRNLIAVRADDFGWSDWGTPEAVQRTIAMLGLAPAWLSASLTAAIGAAGALPA